MVGAQAAAWIARLYADRRTDADTAAFRAWLAEDPLHREMFDLSTSIWEAAALQNHRTVAVKPRASRRAVMAGIGAGVVGAGSLIGFALANANVTSTAVGEQKKVVLPDGSTMLLDTDSRVRCHFTDRVRGAVLERGRVAFELVNADAPFVIQARDAVLRGVTGDLDISALDDSTCVFLTKGHATLSRSGAQGQAPVLLGPGERVVLTNSEPAKADRPEPDKVIAWHSGRAVFENQTAAVAAAEMDRYSHDKIEIDDPELAMMPVSGVFRTGDSQGFARSLSILFSAEVTEKPGRILLTKKKSRS